MALQTEELKVERKANPPAVYRLHVQEQEQEVVTPIQVKWNLVVIVQKIVHTHALTGSITLDLEELRVEKEDKAYQ
eukprot:7210588-Karenia_brevis.AAC.1